MRVRTALGLFVVTLCLLLTENAGGTVPTAWEQRAYSSVEVGIFAMTDSIPFEPGTNLYVNVRRCVHRHGAPLACEARLDYENSRQYPNVRCSFTVFATPQQWRFPRALFGCPREWWTGASRRATRPNLNDLQQQRPL
jgi:hypothetical protein